jgi:hypothetical protein
MLTACADTSVKPVSVVTKEVPVYVVPHSPPYVRPVLAITQLTDAQKDDQGELTKAYAISLKQTMQYACKLERIVDGYNDLASKSPTPVTPLPQALVFGAASVYTLAVDVTKDCNEKN